MGLVEATPESIGILLVIGMAVYGGGIYVVWRVAGMSWPFAIYVVAFIMLWVGDGEPLSAFVYFFTGEAVVSRAGVVIQIEPPHWLTWVQLTTTTTMLAAAALVHWGARKGV